MNYQEKLDALNRELIKSGATLDSMRDLFTLQLLTERSRVMSEQLEVGESSLKELHELKSDIEIHQELIEMGVQEPQSTAAFKAKLTEVTQHRMLMLEQLAARQGEIEAKLEILGEPQFLESLVKGDLSDNLGEAFKIYSRKFITAGAAKLSLYQ